MMIIGSTVDQVADDLFFAPLVGCGFRRELFFAESPKFCRHCVEDMDELSVADFKSVVGVAIHVGFVNCKFSQLWA